MTPPPGSRDPMGWRYRLQLALEDPSLPELDRAQPPTPEACEAAYDLAVSLGYCRLFGVDLPPELDGTLPAPVANAAATELIGRLALWTQQARQLPAQWDAGPPGIEDQYSADLLCARMDAWAAFLAISEAHEAALSEPQASGLDTMPSLLAALDAFDSALRTPEVLPLLCSLAESQLLDNWRRMLRIPEGDFLPWWLDGTLEAETGRIEAETLSAAQELMARAPGHLAPTPLRRHRAAAVLNVQMVEALAAAPSDEVPPVPTLLKWASPDGQWMARLSCPRQIQCGSRLPLEFLTPQGQPAVALSGQPARLAGQREIIDAQAVARFDLQKLRADLSDPADPLTLQVGHQPVEWPPILPE